MNKDTSRVADLPYGKVSSAVAKLFDELGDNGTRVVNQLDRDPSFRRRVANFATNGGYTPSVDQRIAREIMGKNFFGIEEAIRHFGVNPSKKQTAALAEIPFTEGVLKSLKDTHILVAVFPMSILDVRKTDNLLFYSSTGGWYESEKFAKNKGTVSWQLVRKTPVEDSMSKNWDEQRSLLSKDDETPSAQVMIYTIIGHYKATGERLFENVYVRTSCMDSDGHCVEIGSFDSDGLGVYNWWVASHDSPLGLSSARRALP